MRLLVTGAAGFVGSHVLPALAAAFPDAEVIGCGDAPGMERLDVTDHTAVGTLIARLRPEGVVHLAAVAMPAAARRDPGRAWAVNHAGTLALAHALAAARPGAAFVFASSAEVYGRSFRDTALDESAPLAPLNPYAATKAAADLALSATPGIRAVRLRAFNHTGPGQTADYVVPAFARQAALIAAGKQAPVMTVGRLNTARDFLDVRDVAGAYASATRYALAGGAGAFNIASGTTQRIGDVLTNLLALAGIAPRVESSSGRGPEIALPLGDATAARTALDWAPTIPWSTTLADVFAEWQARVREPR